MAFGISCIPNSFVRDPWSIPELQKLVAGTKAGNNQSLATRIMYTDHMKQGEFERIKERIEKEDAEHDSLISVLQTKLHGR